MKGGNTTVFSSTGIGVRSTTVGRTPSILLVWLFAFVGRWYIRGILGEYNRTVLKYGSFSSASSFVGFG
jgi:hypothetical protein